MARHVSRTSRARRDTVEHYVEAVEAALAVGDAAEANRQRQWFAEEVLKATREAYAQLLLKHSHYGDRSEFENDPYWGGGTTKYGTTNGTFWIEDGSWGWARPYSVLISMETGFLPNLDDPDGWKFQEEAGDIIAGILNTRASIYIESVNAAIDYVVIDSLDDDYKRVALLFGARPTPNARHVSRHSRTAQPRPAKKRNKHQRRLILPGDVVDMLFDWHGGQSTAVYSLASTGKVDYVSLAMIELAMEELDQIAGRTQVDSADLDDVRSSLELVYHSPEEFDAVTEHGVAEEHEIVMDGLQDNPGQVSRRSRAAGPAGGLKVALSYPGRPMMDDALIQQPRVLYWTDTSDDDDDAGSAAFVYADGSVLYLMVYPTDVLRRPRGNQDPKYVASWYSAPAVESYAYPSSRGPLSFHARAAAAAGLYRAGDVGHLLGDYEEHQDVIDDVAGLLGVPVPNAGQVSRRSRSAPERKPPRIRITYERWTPEDVEHGEPSDTGWIDEDGTEIDPEQDDISGSALDWLVYHGATEPSSSHFHPGIWYTDYGDADFRTGERENRSYHLDGFTEEEERAIFDRIRRNPGQVSRSSRDVGDDEDDDDDDDDDADDIGTWCVHCGARWEDIPEHAWEKVGWDVGEPEYVEGEGHVCPDCI